MEKEKIESVLKQLNLIKTLVEDLKHDFEYLLQEHDHSQTKLTYFSMEEVY